jgi:cytochrome P450 family 4
MLVLSLLNPVVLVLLVSVLVIMCRYHRKWARMVSLINRIPGPPSLPFIGNAIEINVDHDGMFTASLHWQDTHL